VECTKPRHVEYGIDGFWIVRVGYRERIGRIRYWLVWYGRVRDWLV